MYTVFNFKTKKALKTADALGPDFLERCRQIADTKRYRDATQK